MNINVEKFKKLLALGITFAVVTTCGVYTQIKNKKQEEKLLEDCLVTSHTNQTKAYDCSIGFVINNEDNNNKIAVSYENLEVFLKEGIYIVPNYKYDNGIVQFIKRNASGTEELLNIERENLGQVLKENFNVIGFTYNDCFEEETKKISH